MSVLLERERVILMTVEYLKCTSCSSVTAVFDARMLTRLTGTHEEEPDANIAAFKAI